MAVVDQKYAKGLSTVLKGAGLNGTEAGARLCELDTLAGRGVRPVDVDFELRRRSVPEVVKETVVSCDERRLRHAIRWVLESEIDLEGLEFAEKDEFWSKRWAWCVNGAHSRRRDKLDKRTDVEVPTHRLHRRAFAEALTANPLDFWDGKSYFTYSVKYEHGKSRALYSGDSLTYFAFSHLLEPVERAWRGRRVVLDPGSGGTVGLVKRLGAIGGAGAVSVMLDYDDFNSQHSTDSMVWVFEELCNLVAYPQDLTDRLCGSFRRSHISAGERSVKSLGTLMSGHRATTFINSVLNCAYILYSHERFKSWASIHVGDDVVIKCGDYADAAAMLTAVRSDGFRMNAMKQSIGRYTAEFLRTAVSGRNVRGYGARSVSSCVSGNWVSSVKLNGEDMMSSMAQHCWTLFNRDGPEVASLLTHTLARRCGVSLKVAHGVALGRIAVNGGPVRTQHKRVTVLTTVGGLSESTASAFSKWAEQMTVPQNAVKSYLTNHLSTVDLMAINLSRTDPASKMLEASWKKTFLAECGVEEQEGRQFSSSVLLVNSEVVSLERAARPQDVGVLCKYPVTMLVAKSLTNNALSLLVQEAGYPPAQDLRAQAFGERGNPVRVAGPVPYSDCRALACGHGVCTVSAVYSYYV